MNWTEPAGLESAVPENPYPGLRPFREHEEHLFFGREGQVDAMIDLLASNNLLVVIGSSGSGKSSLVNCGLRPALRRGLMTSAGSSWRMAQFRPGANPIRAMARALAKKGVLYDEDSSPGMSLEQILEANLRMSRLGLSDVIAQARLPEDENLLLVVDQFEELFRYRQVAAQTGKADEDEAAMTTDLVNLLLHTVEHSPQVYTVFTMRSDFLSDCAHYPGLAEAINSGQYLVPRLTRSERRSVIAGPALVANAKISPPLLTRLINDVDDEPDQLSILQHALHRTWIEGEHGKHLTLESYEAVGTKTRALDKHAESAYARLATDRQRDICEKMFKALTDRASDTRGVRRPTSMRTLQALTGATLAEISDVANLFRDSEQSFLMPPMPEAIDEDTVLDISHESLMRIWRRLRRWTDEERRAAEELLLLTSAATRFEKGLGDLLSGTSLKVAIDWRRDNNPNAAWAGQYARSYSRTVSFLELSEQKQEELQALEDKRQRQEFNRTKARSRTYFVLLCLSLASLVAALHQGLEASAATEKANYHLARLFEERAEDPSNGEYPPVLIYTLTALIQDKGENWLPKSLGRLLLPELSPSQNWQSGWCAVDELLGNPAADLAQNADAAPTATMPCGLWFRGDTPCGSMARSRHERDTGQNIAAITAWAFDQQSAGDTSLHLQDRIAVELLTHAPKNKIVAGVRRIAEPTLDEAEGNPQNVDRRVLLWDLPTDAAEPAEEEQALRYSFRCADQLSKLVISPDGRWLASAAGDRVLLHAILPTAAAGAAGKAWSATFACEGGDVASLTFRPDGRMLAAGAGSSVQLWQLDNEDTWQSAGAARSIPGREENHSGHAAKTPRAAGERVRCLRFAEPMDRAEPSGVLTIGMESGRIALLDAKGELQVARDATGTPMLCITARTTGSSCLVAAGDERGTVTLWEATGQHQPRLLAAIPAHTASVHAVALSHTAPATLASVASDGSVRRIPLAVRPFDDPALGFDALQLLRDPGQHRAQLVKIRERCLQELGYSFQEEHLRDVADSAALRRGRRQRDALFRARLLRAEGAIEEEEFYFGGSSVDFSQVKGSVTARWQIGPDESTTYAATLDPPDQDPQSVASATRFAFGPSHAKMAIAAVASPRAEDALASDPTAIAAQPANGYLTVTANGEQLPLLPLTAPSQLTANSVDSNFQIAPGMLASNPSGTWRFAALTEAGQPGDWTLIQHTDWVVLERSGVQLRFHPRTPEHLELRTSSSTQDEWLPIARVMAWNAIPREFSGEFEQRVLKIQNVSLNGWGNAIHVAPGAEVKLRGNWSASVQMSKDELGQDRPFFCPDCIVQFYVGMPGPGSSATRSVAAGAAAAGPVPAAGFSKCLLSSQMQQTYPGASGPIDCTFVAPKEPGVYYITWRHTLAYEPEEDPSAHSRDPFRAFAAIRVR